MDKTASFTEAALLKTEIFSHQIKHRVLEVAIPKQTTPAQWQQLKRAVDYGKKHSVDINITVIK